MYEEIIKDLEDLKNPEKAKILSGFFKTWKGGYGEWDKFLWIPVPEQREIAKLPYRFRSSMTYTPVTIFLNA